jgi:GH24 family phage-related lysozyme (muramidase)
MRPVEYAADGVKDKEVSGPILVGEKGAELVVPTGEGKVSILDAKTTSGLMQLSDGGSNTEPMLPERKPEIPKRGPFQDNRPKLEAKFKFAEPRKSSRTKPQADEDENFVNYMKKVENAQLLGGDVSMLEYVDANESDTNKKTIGYGHVITDKERESGKIYGYDIENLTIEQANEILKRDLSKAYDQLTNTFGRQFLDLDDRRKQMLVDMQFNLGSLEAFPKFTEALFAGDETTMMKEYKRSFRDPESGNMKPLTGRNKDFNEFFFKGMAKASLVTKPIKKAEKGAKNVEIGKAEPAGFFFRNPATPDKPSGGEKLLNFFFGDKDEEQETPSSMGPSPSYGKAAPLPNEFDISKIIDEDGGVDVTYFYDNIEEIARYGFQQRFGTDREPTEQELKDAEEEAFAKMRAYLDISLQKSEKNLLELRKEEYRKPDPYDPLGKRKQKMLDEYGPDILPEA